MVLAFYWSMGTQITIKKFGFKEEIGRLFVPPYPLKYPAGWTGMTLDARTTPDTPSKFESVSALSNPALW